MKRALSIALCAGVALVSPACSSAAPDENRIAVAAAASLTEPFDELARLFEEAHPGTVVDVSYGPSDALALQIVEGAPFDVFAAASPRWMEHVATEGPGVTDVRDFARNRLIVVTPTSNPASIEQLGDVTEPGVRLVVAADGVPVGDYAWEMLSNAGIADAARGNVVSHEIDAAAVVHRVATGEADAGIVYASDQQPGLRAVEIPDDVNVIATYPIAVLNDAQAPQLAAEFEDFVTGPEGQRVLRDSGFLAAQP